MRIKNRRGERNQAIGKRSVPSSISLPNSDHKSSPASPKRLQPELAGAERRAPRVRSAEAAGEGNGRVGWAWLARGRARNKAAPAPPTWSWGVAQARGAGRAERRSFGTMAPLPSLPRPPARPPSGARVQRRGAGPGARPPKSGAGGRGDGGGGRLGLKPVPSAGAQAAAPSPPGRGVRELSRHKEERDPAPRGAAPGFPPPPPTARAGRPGTPHSLTHSSVPQLMAEPEATWRRQAGFPLLRSPRLFPPRARAAKSLPRKLPPTTGFPSE